MSLSKYLYLESKDWKHPWAMAYGIYFLDEIDKILTHVHGRNVNDSSLDAQASLLKVLEEGTLRYSYGQGSFRICLRNATIIMAGAFEGMLDDESIHLSSFDKDNKNNGLMSMSDQLKYAGFTHEFIGRIGNVFKLHSLDKSDFLYILKNINTSVMDTLKTEVKELGYDLEFSDDALELAAREVAKSGLGVRGLEGILRPAVNKLTFDVKEIFKEQIFVGHYDLYPYVSQNTIDEFERDKHNSEELVPDFL